MKTLIVSALFILVACHHDTAPQSPATATSDDQALSVDPTMPSWAPPVCKTYHTAVVQLTGCTQVAHDVREQVSSKYDADSKAWHQITNATQADLDQVKTACSDNATAVKAQITPDCTKGIGEEKVQAQQ